VVPTGLEAAAALARAALYLGLTLAAGVVTVDTLARSSRPVRDASGGRSHAWPAAVGAILMLVAPLGMLELQRVALELSRAELPILLRETAWGPHWIQLATACVATVVSLVFMTWRAGARRFAAPGSPWSHVSMALLAVAGGGVVATAAAMSGLGHAAADPEWPTLSRTADSLHALAASVWIGGLALTAWRWRGASGHEPAAAWAAFSRVATVAAPVVLLSGVVSSWRRFGPLEVATLGSLLGTPYGQLLAAKCALVLILLAIGARQRQRIAARKNTEPRAIGTELLFALLVFGVTAVLTGTEPPAQRP
jgi:putative copper resistance protein D